MLFRSAFTPWNFPINQAVRKVSAALTTGCSIIVKAAEETPAAPAALLRAFADAGLDAALDVAFTADLRGGLSAWLADRPAEGANCGR